MTLCDFEHNSYFKDNPQMFNELVNLVENYPIKYSAMLQANGAKPQSYSARIGKKLYAWMNNVLPDVAKGISTKEKCYWVLNGITEFPICLTCGKLLTSKQYRGMHDGYFRYCNFKCYTKSETYSNAVKSGQKKAVQNDPLYYKKKTDKARQTRFEKYGAFESDEIRTKRRHTLNKRIEENPDFYKEVHGKSCKTNVKNGHSPTWHNVESMVKTRYEKNGGVWETDEMHANRRRHAIEKYGVDDANKSDIVKLHKRQAFEKKHGRGVTCVFQTDEFKMHMVDINEQRKEKEYATKKRNNSFHTSKPEEQCYHMLHFIYPHLVRQYRSEKYPFACDFYDPDSDTYFEFNGSWTHGGHWFDANNEEDQKKLKKWRDGGTKYYDIAIRTWTERDLKKRQCTIDNDLRYMVFWTIDDVIGHVVEEWPNSKHLCV